MTTSAARAPAARGERPALTRLLIWLLGGWLFLTVAMAFIASANFRVLDSERLRDAAQIYSDIPAGPERHQALRYAASEVNRYLFSVYGTVHLVLAGAALVLFVLSRRRSRLVLAGLVVCLGLSLAFAFWFTPTMVELGRVIDFMPRDPEPPEVTRFYLLHTINVRLELVKMLLIIGAAVALIRR